MAMRRRRYRRRFAGRSGGRSFYWFRFGAFNLTSQEVATGILSDIVLTESDWADPSSSPNQTKRGGPRLERFILDYGFVIEAEVGYFLTAGDGNIAWIPEFMAWKQSDQFATVVTDATSWEATRDNQRVFMNETPAGARELMPLQQATNTPDVIRSVQGRYETKSKVRLSEGAIGFGWRTYLDLGAVNLNGFTDWVRPTFLISVP